MTIYLDIIFAENILMNFIILFTTLIIIKVKIEKQQIRLLISSTIGSVYAIIVYLNILKIYSSILVKIILSIVMIYIAFNPKNINQLFKELLTFYLISFVFGGCTFALIYFIKPENVKINNGVFVGIYPIKVTLIAGIIAFFIIEIVFKINKNKLNSKNIITTIKIYIDNKKITTKALLDSGNMLEEPISKMPVIILERDILSKIVSKDLLENIKKIIGGEKSADTLEEKEIIKKVRMVPFMSIGKENGMLLGIRANKVEVENEDVDIKRKNIIIAIYNNKLTKDNKYNALIGLNLLEGEK